MSSLFRSSIFDRDCVDGWMEKDNKGRPKLRYVDIKEDRMHLRSLHVALLAVVVGQFYFVATF